MTTNLLKGNQVVLVPLDSPEMFARVGLSPHGGATSAVSESSSTAAVAEPPFTEATTVAAAKGAPTTAAEAAATTIAAETSTS